MPRTGCRRPPWRARPLSAERRAWGSEPGFTLVELMVTVAVIGVLVAIAIPNFISTSNRAKEASLKTNMHAFQLVAENFLIDSDTKSYATSASDLIGSLPPDFKNPFDGSTGSGNAWEDRASVSADPSTKHGIASYADSSSGTSYNVKGYGAKGTLSLVLTSGRD